MVQEETLLCRTWTLHKYFDSCESTKAKKWTVDYYEASVWIGLGMGQGRTELESSYVLAGVLSQYWMYGVFSSWYQLEISDRPHTCRYFELLNYSLVLTFSKHHLKPITPQKTWHNIKRQAGEHSLLYSPLELSFVLLLKTKKVQHLGSTS